jgi:four helix bundle protein
MLIGSRVATLSEQFADFEKTPPPELFGDPIWRLPAYRIALFLSDVARLDVPAMLRRSVPVHITGQLERAIDSIGVNIAEGYSRYSGKERARFYEIALGSAREAREWYRRSIKWFGEEPALERAQLLTRVVRILLVAVPQERAGASEDRIRKRSQRAPHPHTGEPSTSSSTSTSTSTSTQE